MTIAARESTERDADVSLVGLLGDARATIVRQLRQKPGRTVSELASELGISAVATRRHLTVLEDDGLVVSRTVKQGRGRPALRWELTSAAGRLLPRRYDEFAEEVLEFLVERHGHDALRDFLRWRMGREVEGLSEAVTAEELHERLDQLSEVLSRAGFDASVEQDGPTFTLIQGNCAIEDVAREHPEICAFEAASFKKALGEDVKISRRTTMASGASQCVCTVTPTSVVDGDRNDPADTPADGVAAQRIDGGVRR